MDLLSMEDRAAASTVAALGGSKRRVREGDSPDDAAGGFHHKAARTNEHEGIQAMAPPLAVAAVARATMAAAAAPAAPEERELQPAPFFFYRDFSAVPDPDALTPLTPPGRVPNFPAKMHSILSRPDLADIVAWMPHGRSWRVLKPREFEVRVIPTYFEHAKFSSFIRQANGWGFRRITQGRDRNSYYHEQFLRGLPHLCKNMKRPGVAEKQAADPDHEPDFYKIAEVHPVPEKAEDDAILLQCTLEGGPKARMPIYTGAIRTSIAPAGTAVAKVEVEATKMPLVVTLTSAQPQLTPRDQEALNAFQQSLGASENQLKNLSFNKEPEHAEPFTLPHTAFASMVPAPVSLAPNSVGGGPKLSPLAAAHQLAFAAPNMAAAFQASTAATQFAAGFAAATALSHQQLRNMLGTFAAGLAPSQANSNPMFPNTSAFAGYQH